MREDDDRPVAGGPVEIRGEGPGRRLVEVLGGLVQDQDADVGEKCPGQGEPLALAPGEARAVLPRLRGEILGERVDPGQELGVGQRQAQLLVRRTRAGEPQVAAIEASNTWGSCSHRPTTRRTSSPASDRTSTCTAATSASAAAGCASGAASGVPDQLQRPGGRLEEAQARSRERALARAAGSRHQRPGAGRDVKVERRERVRLRGWVAERKPTRTRAPAAPPGLRS